MMAKLRFKVLGHPAVFLNQKEIFFSFSKINALLYYLLVQKTANRDEVANLLWEEKSEAKAKKNLRNTIYQANKILGTEVIIAPNRSLLTLNPDIQIDSDVQIFASHPAQHLDLYQGDFLQGFYIKSSRTFELWLSDMRSHYEQLYIKYSYQKIENHLASLDLEETEANLHHLIQMEPYEEKNYYLLMRLYQRHDCSRKVIETYYQLTQVLKHDLGISPNDNIQEIYHQVLAQEQEKEQAQVLLDQADYFFGRTDEITALEHCFSSVIRNQEVQVAVLTGRTGVGKRTIARQVLANQVKYFQIIAVECFSDEKEIPFQVWQDLLDYLGDLFIQHQVLSFQQWQDILNLYFPSLTETVSTASHALQKIDSHLLSQLLLDLLPKLAQKEALAILIEESQWMDAESITLLQYLLNHLTGCPIAFILTKDTAPSTALDNLFHHLEIRQKLSLISIEPFNEQDCLTFLQEGTDDLQISKALFEQIYQTSQGLPVYLKVYAQQLQAKQPFEPLPPIICTQLSLKLEQLTPSQENLLHYLSCFRKPISLSLLAQLSGELTTAVNQDIDFLCQKHLLDVLDHEEGVLVQFHQQLMKLYCYESLASTRKRFLHCQIAMLLEQLYETEIVSPQVFADISYHYQLAKESVKSLKYQLRYLSSILQFHHELFPIYSVQMDFVEQEQQDELEKINRQFELISQRIDELKPQYQHQKEFRVQILQFLYLQGRYAIRIGNYQEGIHLIQQVIALASELQQTDYLLEGYRQLIYYCIQTENTAEMIYYVRLALEASVQLNNHEAIGVHLRLEGLYYLITGEAEKAKRLLQQSIDCFRLTHSLETKYAVHIAAALDYLAEMEQVNGHFSEAIAYQEEAIYLSEHKVAEPSLVSFQISLGISYYLSGNYQQADSIFQPLKKEMRKLRFPWKEVQLELYLALLQIQKRQYEEVINLLSRQDALIARYSNPRDKGMIYYLMAIIRHQIDEGKIECPHIEKKVSETFSFYAQIALSHLNPYRDRHFIAQLESIKQELAQ